MHLYNNHPTWTIDSPGRYLGIYMDLTPQPDESAILARVMYLLTTFLYAKIDASYAVIMNGTLRQPTGIPVCGPVITEEGTIDAPSNDMDKKEYLILDFPMMAYHPSCCEGVFLVPTNHKYYLLTEEEWRMIHHLFIFYKYSDGVLSC